MTQWDEKALLAVMRPKWPAPISIETARALIARGRHQVRLAPGSVLIRQGEIPRGIVIWLEGKAAVTGVSASGREFILSFMGPGDGYGFVPCYTQTPDTTSLVAHEPAAALVVPYDQWLRTADEHPELKDAVIAVMCQRMRWMTDNLEYRSMAPAIARMARLLYLYVQRLETIPSLPAGRTTPVELRLGQATLASMLSLSRQRTHQLLHKLEQDGAISLAYGRIVVRDLSCLQRVMNAIEDA
ncbi:MULTISPECIES: Crp/Fnr family transcriptional regulator [Comamonas]|uniref:Crp/Fnr family transcriptional regulator n=1 Tax=Comamonas TaxID=283 RepID=UPI0015F85E5D|nr:MULTISPECIES: Crp/Fnr family transcriptional regulator [Comamonas]UUC95032.1 Crp/Fnr family transcriptional regulator [Comamonas sp. C11]WEE79069.1 Crp/Fnr family transcriptional regulator [Comamonas testosteroni]